MGAGCDLCIVHALSLTVLAVVAAVAFVSTIVSHAVFAHALAFLDGFAVVVAATVDIHVFEKNNVLVWANDRLDLLKVFLAGIFACFHTGGIIALFVSLACLSLLLALFHTLGVELLQLGFLGVGEVEAFERIYA